MKLEAVVFMRRTAEHKTRIALIVDGFLNGAYLRNVATIFCRDLYTVLWTLCLIIPGIVKSYEYKNDPLHSCGKPSDIKEESV